MGIKNFHCLFRKKLQDEYHEYKLSELEGMTLAIDTSIFICKFHSSLGNRWLSGFYSMIKTFSNLNVKMIFVFDGKNPPIEKTRERETRVINRKKNKTRISSIIDEWFEVENNIDINTDIIEKMEEIKEKPFLYEYLRKMKVDEDYIEKKAVVKSINKLMKNLVPIKEEDFILLKELLSLLNLTYFESEDNQEAEGLCSLLVMEGLADACLSEDTDVIAYGCPKFLFGIDFKNQTIQCLVLEEILTSLEFTYDQLKDLCIMMGTDYNSNLKLIGPIKSFDLISKYKSLDKIADNIDTSELNYPRGRLLFDCKRFNVPSFEILSEPIDFTSLDLQKFLFYNNVNQLS